MPRTSARAWFAAAVVVLLALLTGYVFSIRFRRVPAIPTIAFVPQTAGSMLWELEHRGATAAAEKLKYHLYWSAPTSENDLAGQISLIDKVSLGRYQGLVLAPNHPLAVLSPLHRVLSAGLPVVIVSAALDLPTNSKLSYIVNDDEKMGEFAAAEIARLTHGKGSVVLVGIGRQAPGVARRLLGAERLLASQYPEIGIVGRVGGAYNASRAEELTAGVANSHPDLKAVLSFTAASTRGAHTALKSLPSQRAIYLVGCEQDSDLIAYVASGEIAAVSAENTYRMGYEAVGLISAALAGKPLPGTFVIPPFLITKQNLHSAEASLLTGFFR